INELRQRCDKVQEQLDATRDDPQRSTKGKEAQKNLGEFIYQVVRDINMALDDPSDDAPVKDKTCPICNEPASEDDLIWDAGACSACELQTQAIILSNTGKARRVLLILYHYGLIDVGRIGGTD